MGKKHASIYDIAKEAGVSVTTVSRVINNPDKVNTHTRRKIYAIMERMNYAPNALAQSLVSRSTETIGVFIHDVKNPFYAEMLYEIEKKAFEKGYSIFIGNTSNQIKKEEAYVELFAKKHVDGIIMVGGRNVREAQSNHILKTAERIPVILTNHTVIGKNIYCICADEAEGAVMAVQHLIDTGRRKIAYINGHEEAYAKIIKKDGYLKTLRRNNLAIDERLIVNAPRDTMEGGYAACEELLGKGGSFDAVFVSNDLMAIGVLKKLASAGIRVPQDVSVVGYDDIQLCKFFSPSLSSVTQECAEIGSMAVQMLIDVLEGKEVHKVTYLKPKLMIRESSSLDAGETWRT